MSSKQVPTKPVELREEATRFLDWCRSNITSIVEKLPPKPHAAFRSGVVPKELLAATRAAWLKQLKTNLEWSDHFTAVRDALPRKEDYSLYMNCQWAHTGTLPPRILRAVAREQRRKARNNYENFVRTGGLTRLKTYLDVWKSKSNAMHVLIAEARGYTRKMGGGASIGGTELDVERMLLSEAEATGSAMQVRALLPFIRSLWETDKTILVRTRVKKVQPLAVDWGPGYERRVVPNEKKSEARLNRFVIKLGRALAARRKRRSLPDWKHMDQTIRMIAEGWCESIIVDTRRWPMLCMLTTPALAKFLSLCTPPYWDRSRNERTLERRIERLGLIRIPKGRITNVEQRVENIYFS